MKTVMSVCVSGVELDRNVPERNATDRRSCGTILIGTFIHRDTAVLAKLQ
jgi:hypothetical protein